MKLPLTLLALASLSLASADDGVADLQITIKTLQAQMRYDTPEFTVSPGQKVKLVLENGDDLPHNLCFFQPGTDVVAVVNQQMEKPEEGLKRNWLPEDPRLWLHTKMLNPHERDALEFTAPVKAEVYPYVCSFPGHALAMIGKMRVQARGPGLTELKFRLYNGDWKALPDFTPLKPLREGEVEDHLLQLKFDDYKNQYGLVFTGKLNAPAAGEYRFLLASDDGARVLVDGQPVVDDDGVHPASEVREGKVTLTAGGHVYECQYFQAAGQAELYAAWKGPGFGITPLSKEVHPDWDPKKRAARQSNKMPLIVGGEPIIYRNFITGGGNRGIAVGYPGNVSLVWSAEALNLAVVWRGGFLDAAQHWESRGGGFQKPGGVGVFHPTELSPPFAVLAEGAAWPVVKAGEHAPGYRWRGYALDAQRLPTFQYDWNGVQVQDHFAVSGDALSAGGKLLRTLTLTGPIPAGALFRVAMGNKLTPQGGGFLVENGAARFIVTAAQATLQGHALLRPASAEMQLTYEWPDTPNLSQ